ncbi:stimulated by retinoic acid gene 6 protein-like, partial [Saccoglossus kowalevskii]
VLLKVLGFPDRFYFMGPSGVFGALIYLIQLWLSKFFFLQDNGKVINVDNRRCFHVTSFVMVYYNVILGIFSCASRFLRNLVFGMLLLGRLDHSVLPRDYELLDPGYRAYVGFLKVEEAHCHPVMRTFCRILQKNIQSKRNLNDMPMTSYRKKSLRSKNRWLIAYTMIHNPSLQLQRSPKLLERVSVLDTKENVFVRTRYAYATHT